MKRLIVLLALLVADGGVTRAAPAVTNAAAGNRVLMIESSSMPVVTGNATLIIGPLSRTNGVYAGDYQLKVFPWFLKNEKGRLAILVSDASLAEAGQGRAVTIIGTATTSGKDGKSRAVTVIATPADINHGTLKLWFTAGSRNMIFTPAYHFAGNGTAVDLAKTTKTKP